MLVTLYTADNGKEYIVLYAPNACPSLYKRRINN